MSNPNELPDFLERARSLRIMVSLHDISCTGLAKVLRDWHEVSYHQGLIYGGFEVQDADQDYQSQIANSNDCPHCQPDPVMDFLNYGGSSDDDI